MPTYRIVTPYMVERLPDHVFIPADPDNVEYQAYLEWVAAGNTPEPASALDAQEAAFALAEDAERLRTINDRARTDPAYAALADIVLRGLSR